MRHNVHAVLPSPFSTTVKAPEIGTGESLCVDVFAVSCYPGEQVTFWLRGKGDWLYCYAPAHWLGAGAATRRPPICPQHTGFTIDQPVLETIQVGGEKATALAVVDFLDSNELLWVLRFAGGRVEVMSHRYFDATPPEGGLRKLRATWV